MFSDHVRSEIKIKNKKMKKGWSFRGTSMPAEIVIVRLTGLKSPWAPFSPSLNVVYLPWMKTTQS
jgi:hypothetical protein